MLGTEQITSQSLHYDAADTLEDYYKQKQELEDQIDIFKEALDTARDDYKALNRKWKGRLKQAGQYKTYTQQVIDVVRENPGIEPLVLRRKIADKFKLPVHHSSTFIDPLICNNTIICKENKCFIGIKKIKNRGEITENIKKQLKTRQLFLAKELAEGADTYSSSITAYLRYIKNKILVHRPFTEHNPTRFNKYQLHPNVDENSL